MALTITDKTNQDARNTTAEDSEVFLPEAVRRAAARANELMATQQQPPDQTPPQDPGQDHPDQPPPQPPPPQPEPPQPLPPAARRQQDEWEQRYRTLQGKYDSEITGLRSQVAGLERLLSTIQAPQPAPPAPAPTPSGPVRYNEEDVNLFGEDLLGAATRAAEARYAPVINQLQTEIQQLRGNTQHLAGQQLQNTVFDALDQDPELNGRWRHLNTDRNFLTWLQSVDEYAGVTRNEMLQNAYANGDSTRTGRFFKRFLAEHTNPDQGSRGNGYAPPAGQPRFNPQQSQTPAAPATPQTPRLEDFAAPGRAAGPGSGGNGAQATRIWSRPEITGFYRDRTAGRFRGREDESARLEADIIAAAREGRIQ